jgi:hypothetical protein
MVSDNPLMLPDEKDLISPNGDILIPLQRLLQSPPTETKELEAWEIQEKKELSQMLHTAGGISGVHLIWGDLGGGKSMYMYWLAFKVRKYFNMGTIVDSPCLTPLYGEAELMLDDEFVKEQYKLAGLVKLYNKMGKIQQLDWASAKVKLYRKAVCWDEGYQKISVHQTSEKVSQAYNALTLQYRHNGCLIMIVSPDANQINRQYANKFATHAVHCTRRENYMGTGELYCLYDIDNLKTHQSYRRKLRASKWGQLYNSEGIITPKVSFEKFKSVKLTDEDEKEIEQWLEQRKYELMKQAGGQNGIS